MNDAFDAVLASWRAAGVKLQAGLAKDSVVATLAAACREVSSDVVRLYERCNGMESGESDGRLFAFWPLEEVMREAGRFDPELLPFADFLLSSHEYGFRVESPQCSSVWVVGLSRDGKPECVAASVEEFFALLQSDPAKLHIATPEEPPPRKRFWSRWW